MHTTLIVADYLAIMHFNPCCPKFKPFTVSLQLRTGLNKVRTKGITGTKINEAR